MSGHADRGQLSFFSSGQCEHGASSAPAVIGNGQSNAPLTPGNPSTITATAKVRRNLIVDIDALRLILVTTIHILKSGEAGFIPAAIFTF